MWTLECDEIDLNESEIDLDESENFLKSNLDQSEIDTSWIDLSVNGPYIGVHYMTPGEIGNE